MKSKLFVLFFFVFGTIGCSLLNSKSPTEHTTPKIQISGDTLDLSQKKSVIAPVIEEEGAVSAAYGPTPVLERKDQIVEREKTLGVFIGAGGARNFASIEFFKILQDKNITVQSVSGLGLGVVVAAYYAAGIPLSKLEWRLYQLFEKTKDVEMYSDPWIQMMSQSVLFPFKNRKIETLAHNFFIPLFDKGERTVVWVGHGDLYRTLVKSLKMWSKGRKGGISAIGKKFSLKPFRKLLNIDYLVGLHLFPPAVSLKKESGFLFGNFKKEEFLTRERAEDCDLNVTMPSLSIYMDSIDRLPKYLLESKKISELISLQLEYALKTNL